MKVEPVARRSLTDGVVDRVRELIDREQLTAGIVCQHVGPAYLADR